MLGIVYNVCIFHIVRWCLVWDFLVVYVKLLGLFQCYKHDECLICSAKFDFINVAYDTEQLLLKTQVSEDFA